MDIGIESQEGSKISYDTIADKCVQCLKTFDALELTELKIRLPIGLAAFYNPDKTRIVKVDILPNDRKLYDIIEPMYFCISSHRQTGKLIYLEQYLSKPCITSYESFDCFLYDVDPKYLAAIRKLISNTQYLTSDLKAITEKANSFYHLNCFNVKGF